MPVSYTHLDVYKRQVEYCAFYYCVGHHDWLIIGIISALGAVIPYIGGTVANAIGILTGLTLPSSNLEALIIGIIVLSNVDNYVTVSYTHLIYVEHDTIMAYRYQHGDDGLQADFLQVCKALGVRVLRASNASVPEEVGMGF